MIDAPSQSVFGYQCLDHRSYLHWVLVLSSVEYYQRLESFPRPHAQAAHDAFTPSHGTHYPHFRLPALDTRPDEGAALGRPPALARGQIPFDRFRQIPRRLALKPALASGAPETSPVCRGRGVSMEAAHVLSGDGRSTTAQHNGHGTQAGPHSFCAWVTSLGSFFGVARRETAVAAAR